MDKEFWHERWQRHEIGFHRDSIHPALEEHWRAISATSTATMADQQPGEPVLVPLCGKCLDMHWLAEQGHPVIGVEIDRSAIEAFFGESRRTPAIDESGSMPSWSTDSITLFSGDFLEFQVRKKFGLVYDRAALIALPAGMRPRYLDHLASLMKPGARGLMITLEYPQEAMQGPPFAVMPNELLAHPALEFKCLGREDVLDSHQRFAEKGLPWVREAVYLLNRKTSE